MSTGDKMIEDIDQKKEYLWSIGFHFPWCVPKRMESMKDTMFPPIDKDLLEIHKLEEELGIR